MEGATLGIIGDYPSQPSVDVPLRVEALKQPWHQHQISMIHRNRLIIDPPIHGRKEPRTFNAVRSLKNTITSIPLASWIIASDGRHNEDADVAAACGQTDTGQGAILAVFAELSSDPRNFSSCCFLPLTFFSLIFLLAFTDILHLLF